jgi:hypothetical protein
MPRLTNWDNGVIPAGRKRGLKREPSRGPRAAYYRDLCDRFPQRKLIPDEHWQELARNQWHKKQRLWYPYTLDQNGIGSCAAESADGSVAALCVRQGLPPVLFNPLGKYHTTSGGSDRGSNIGDNMKFAMDRGCYPEEVWPRSKGFRVKPSAEANRIAKFFRLREFFRCTTIAEVISAVLQGYLCHGGYSGHAVSFCGYIHPGKLLFKNSWGPWGDNGFGTLSANKIYFAYGMYAYEDVIPYVEADPAGGWKWLSPWKPKYNQADLAARVARYSYDVMAKPRNRIASDRKVMYNDYVSGCKLAS